MNISDQPTSQVPGGPERLPAVPVDDLKDIALPAGREGVRLHGNQITIPRKETHLKEIDYKSASEAACGMLLEKYLPSFRVEPGKSYQIALKNEANNTVYVDFLIGRVFLEYHPIRMWRKGQSLGEFASRKEREQYRSVLKNAEPEHRDEIRRMYRCFFKERYTKERREILNNSPATKDKELIVASSPKELYDVVSRFSPSPPEKGTFVEEFEALRKQFARDRKKRKDKDPDQKKKSDPRSKKDRQVLRRRH